MEEGEPISPYLVKKLNSNYGVAVSIIDSIKSTDKKKSVPIFSSDKGSNRNNQALRTLLLYEPAYQVSENMMSLISHSDKTTQRLAYYHLNWLQKKIQNKESAFKAVTGELNDKVIFRKLFALRTFSHLVLPQDRAAEAIIDFSESVFQQKQSFNKKDSKKTTTDATERITLQYGAVLAIRQLSTAPLRPTFLQAVLQTIEQGEMAASVRHAIAILIRYAEDQKFTSQVAEQVRKFLPNAAGSIAVKSRIGEDPFARVYFVQLISMFTDPRSLPQESKQYCAEYYEALGHFVWDLSPRVAFEAIQKLSQSGWSRLEKSTVTPISDNQYTMHCEEPSVVTRIIQRLTCELYENQINRRKFQCLVHAALRSVIIFAQTYVSSDSSSQEDIENPLAGLFGPLQLLLQDSSDSIRLKILTSFVWLCQAGDSNKLIEILMNEIRMDTLSLQMYNDLLWSFHERIIVTPDTAPLVLKLILTLATHRPDKLPTKPVIQLWKKIISVSSDGKSLVQKNVFDILDYNFTENHSVIHSIQRIAFHLLGEEAVTLTLNDDKPASIKQPNLRSIILRLEHAANCASWETRNVCIESLSKIAFLSPMLDVRAHIISFFESIGYNWNAYLRSIVDLLKSLVKCQSKWQKIYEDNNRKLSDAEKNQFQSESKSILDSVSVFCSFPVPTIVQF